VDRTEHNAVAERVEVVAEEEKEEEEEEKEEEEVVVGTCTRSSALSDKV